MKPYVVVATLLALGFGSTMAIAQISIEAEDPEAFLSLEENSCQGCDLSNVIFPAAPPTNEAFYTNAQLRQANLSGAVLQNLDLTGSYFTCADLSGADLSGANLTNVDFIYANLSGANLSGATLSATTFRGAIIDASTDLSGAVIDGNTIAPNSYFAQEVGPMYSVTPIPLDGRQCFGRPE